MLQGVLPFESVEDLYRRVFRQMKPRTPAPDFDVRFRPYANLDSKIRLEAGHRRISVKISDQLEQAPPQIHESLAWVLLSKLYRKQPPEEVVERYRSFINRKEIRDRAMDVRRSRGRKQVRHPRGRTYDLEAMFDELNAAYFEGTLKKPRIGWSPNSSKRLLGHYDPAHDTIVLSGLLDEAHMPEYVTRYVLFHEMLHLKHPVEYRDSRRCVHSREFKAEERKFPEYAAAIRFLKTL